jgi:hypothetical protein
MKAAAIRRSRWVSPKRRVNFHEGDIAICKLLTPNIRARYPWGYTYLPTRYFAPLLQRGARGTPNRLSALRGADYLRIPDQGRNNCRDIVWQLGKAGAAEVRDLGFTFDPDSRPLPHELGACLVAANIELGARKCELPIDLISIPRLTKRPDWPVFRLCGHAVLLEFDTGTESSAAIKGKYECYLQLLHSQTISKLLFLFVTTKPNRIDGVLIQTLKDMIDQHQYPYAYAQNFVFGYMKYDRHLNKIPEPSGWVVTEPLQRAGSLEPFLFYRG